MKKDKLTHRFPDAGIVLQRANQRSKKWHAKYSVDGKKLRQDTETHDLDEALLVATQRKNELEILAKHGVLDDEKLAGMMQSGSAKRSISVLIRAVEKYYRDSDKNPSTYESYIHHLYTHVDPIIGKLDISELHRDGVLNRVYVASRGTYSKINNLNKLKTALNTLQDIAKQKGYLSQRIKLPDPNYSTANTSSFIPINESDIMTMITMIPEFCSGVKIDGRRHTEDSIIRRKLLMPTLIFVIETGLRGIGEELRGIQWKHLSFEKTSYDLSGSGTKVVGSPEGLEYDFSDDEKRYLRHLMLMEMGVYHYRDSLPKAMQLPSHLEGESREAVMTITKGKNSQYGEREIALNLISFDMLKVITEIQACHGIIVGKPRPDDYIFDNGNGIGVPSGYMRAMIELCGDKLTQTRYSSYSARTTFVHRKLDIGFNVFDISKFCGTSVKTIEKNYANKYEGRRSNRRIASPSKLQ